MKQNDTAIVSSRCDNLICGYNPVAGPHLMINRSACHHAASDRLPVGSVLVGTMLGTMILPHLAPINRSNILTVGFWIHSERFAPSAGAELHALDEPLAEFLFRHRNRLSLKSGPATRNP